MPGPVSDSYDPEFGTSSNADDVRTAIRSVTEKIGHVLGSELKNIVSVAQQGPRGKKLLSFTENELRVIRFSLNKVLDEM